MEGYTPLAKASGLTGAGQQHSTTTPPPLRHLLPETAQLPLGAILDAAFWTEFELF